MTNQLTIPSDDHHVGDTCTLQHLIDLQQSFFGHALRQNITCELQNLHRRIRHQHPLPQFRRYPFCKPHEVHL